MKLLAWACVPVLVLGTAVPAGAAKPKKDERAVEAPATTPEAVVADAACSVPKKEKKKVGFGGLLRAARNSGLLNIVAGQVGAAGAVAGSVASTAVDVAETAAPKVAPQLEGRKC